MKSFEDGKYIVSVTDSETGEVLMINSYDSPSIISKAERERNKRYYEIQSKQEEDNIFTRKWQNSQGNFVWYKYMMCIKSEYQDKLILADYARLMVLATYLDYSKDGAAANRLVDDTGHPLRKHQIVYEMRLTYNRVKPFFKALMDNNILYPIEGVKDEWALNPDIFLRGKLSEDIRKAITNEYKTVIRLYIKGIRNIFMRVQSRQIKLLAYLFYLIPYANKKYNILCSNPLETNLDDIKPLRFVDCCRIIGYSEKHYDRLFKELMSIIVVVDGKDQSVISCVSNGCNAKTKSNYRLFVNPNILYAGDCKDWNTVAILGKFSEVAEKDN